MVCVHLGELASHFRCHPLEETVGGLLDRVLGRAGDAFGRLSGQGEGIPGGFQNGPALDDPQADGSVFTDHPAGIVIGPPRGDPDDVEIELTAEVGGNSWDRVDRPMDHRQVQPSSQQGVGALLGSGCRVLQGDLRGRDSLDSLVVNGLVIGSSVLQPEIDSAKLEADRQSLGKPMDRPRKLVPDSVPQQFRDLVGGSHDPGILPCTGIPRNDRRAPGCTPSNAQAPVVPQFL